MTRMLASVLDAAEAELAVCSGVDIIDIKDPTQGALGAASIEVIEAIVTQVARRKLVSAVAGEQWSEPRQLAQSLARLLNTAVDIIKIGLSPMDWNPALAQILQDYAARRPVVVVLFATPEMTWEMIAELAALGVMGVMLDTVDKTAGSLRTVLADARLKDFIMCCKQARIQSGLAGALRRKDIMPLLALQPDYLGFRGALCRGHDRQAVLSAEALAEIRQFIPLD